MCEGFDVIGALGALADRSLVHLDPVTPIPRWRMLDVVREIAADLEPWHLPSRRAAFMSYYRRLLEDVSSRLGQERSWYQVLSADVGVDADEDFSFLDMLRHGGVTVLVSDRG